MLQNSGRQPELKHQQGSNFTGEHESYVHKSNLEGTSERLRSKYSPTFLPVEEKSHLDCLLLIHSHLPSQIPQTHLV